MRPVGVVPFAGCWTSYAAVVPSAAPHSRYLCSTKSRSSQATPPPCTLLMTLSLLSVKAVALSAADGWRAQRGTSKSARRAGAQSRARAPTTRSSGTGPGAGPAPPAAPTAAGREAGRPCTPAHEAHRLTQRHRRMPGRRMGAPA